MIGIEVRRVGLRNHHIVKDDRKIGEVWRMSGKQGFGLSLIGITWRDSKPVITGGCTSVYIKRLKDVPAFVDTTLSNSLFDLYPPRSE